MGTTVSGILRVDDKVAIAHIGDSRIYLYRDDALTQITTDHTFVQRLVDSGRITLEEARYHPRRSVLMRVLSDMDIDPDLDMFVMPTRPGDRWLLCSDGLSGVVDDIHIAKAMSLGLAPGRTADVLLKRALDGGAPDNVTMVLVDVGGAHPLSSGTPTVVGAASNPSDLPVPAPRGSLTSWLHPVLQAANEPSHFEPDSDYFEEIIEEDRRRRGRRRIAWLAALVVALLALVGCGILAYNWTQTRYFVGADDDSVVIYRGGQQDLGPIKLSTEVKDTFILLADLPNYQRASVERTINARSYADAIAITERLRTSALPPIPVPIPSPVPETPTPTPTGVPTP
jgi:protein phosphatase